MVLHCIPHSHSSFQMGDNVCELNSDFFLFPFFFFFWCVFPFFLFLHPQKHSLAFSLLTPGYPIFN